MITIEDDDADCEIVDCTMAIAKEKCPKTCTEPDVCKMADCTKSKSLEKCPMKCSGSSKEDTGKKKLVEMMVTLHIGTNINAINKAHLP